METFNQRPQYNSNNQYSSNNQYNQNNQYSQQNAVKTGKKINTDDLLKYIETNKETTKNVNVVDLNETVSEQNLTSIDKASFQSIQEIKFLPPKLAQIFKINSTKYLHAGCLRSVTIRNGKHQTNLQISLLSSIITCFHASFSTMPVVNQSTFIQKLFERLRIDSSGSKFTQFGYNKKYKWHKTEIETELLKCSYDGKVLKYLSDYFHINIFVLDLERDQLYYPGDEYIPFKNTIFVLKFADGTFEPISTQNIKVFSTQNQIINEIRENPDYVSVLNLGDKMSIGIEEIEEDLKQYIPQEKVRVKHEKQSEIAEREEKEKNLTKKSDEFDESMNAYTDSEDEKPQKKLKEKQANEKQVLPKQNITLVIINTEDSKSEISESESSESEDEKPAKIQKTKKIEAKTEIKAEIKVEPKIKSSDVKSSMKIDELRKIATTLEISHVGKTKAILLAEIKENLEK